MSEDQKLDAILKQCVKRFEFNGVDRRVEMQAFWQQVCVQTTDQRDTTHPKFMAYVRKLIGDGYVEFEETQQFHKATIEGKRFKGYVHQTRVEKQRRLIPTYISIAALAVSSYVAFIKKDSTQQEVIQLVTWQDSVNMKLILLDSQIQNGCSRNVDTAIYNARN